MTSPIVYLAGAVLTFVAAVAAAVGARRGKESDVAVAFAAEAREWADDFRIAEQECRDQLVKVRAELEALRRSTTAELDELRTEVARLRNGGMTGETP